MQIKQNSKDSIDSSSQEVNQKMNIALFYKPSMMKVCSFLILVSFIVGIPTQANAGFFDFITGAEAEVSAEEFGTDDMYYNSQTMPLLEASTTDMKNVVEEAPSVLVEDDSLLASSGLIGSGLESVSSGDITIYTVKAGDTLSQIAEDFDVSQNTIRWENGFSGGEIKIGQDLRILPVTGVKHVVKSGDTLAGIANKYDADIDDIKVFNDISSGGLLKAGAILIVPNGTKSTEVVRNTSSGTSTSTSGSSSASTNSSGYYMKPASGIITSPYGPRKSGYHYGIDIGNKRGTPVVAAAAGTVTGIVSYCKEGATSCGGRYGNYIVIQHANGQVTRYAHLQSVKVSVGQKVAKGKTIGAIGNTGRSTGPHLHYQVEKSNGSTIRPVF